MLPAAHRLRRSADLERTVRRGVRAGGSTVVVHLAQHAYEDESPQVGFVVSKAVGNAVRRNTVKRRLRAAATTCVAGLPGGTTVVVRALPSSAEAEYPELQRDLEKGLARALDRWAARTGSP